MVKSSSWIVSGMVACATLVALVPMPACNDSKGYHEPSSTLRIVSVTGPKDNALTCDSRANTGACPFSVNVTFRLPAEQFVWKAYVRFQGDGDDVGVRERRRRDRLAAQALAEGRVRRGGQVHDLHGHAALEQGVPAGPYGGHGTGPDPVHELVTICEEHGHHPHPGGGVRRLRGCQVDRFVIAVGVRVSGHVSSSAALMATRP